MRSYYIAIQCAMDCACCAELELHSLTVGDASICHALQARPRCKSATVQVCHSTVSTRTRPMVVKCPPTIHVCRKMSVCMRKIGALALLIPYFDPASIPSQRLWRRNFGWVRDVHSSAHSAVMDS